jgi:hypothetical protein
MSTIYTQADVGAHTTLDSGLYTIAPWSNQVKSEQKDTVFLQASSQSIPYFLILYEKLINTPMLHPIPLETGMETWFYRISSQDRECSPSFVSSS